MSSISPVLKVFILRMNYWSFVQATEWKNTANNFPLHFVSQSFQVGYYNKDKGNCQAPSFLFL